MSYPSMLDYQEAVQEPHKSFTDTELKSGKVAETNLGLPFAMTGGFALTYTVQCGPRKFAVRCFHREVPQAETRYAQVSAKLRALSSPYFVNFDFQGRGIVVRGQRYPVVKMDWVDGETLGIFLDHNATSPTALATLRQNFANLAEYLERNGVAHGDIQNDNVMVSKNAVRLIDYDGMFVTGMPEGKGSEVGHKHFQHPGRTANHFGPKMDRFSFLVIDVSLEALQANASLHKRFREGGVAIIFKANDFADPASSDVFRVLNGMAGLQDSAKKLAAVCGASINSVPSLADFRAGRNIPTPAFPAASTTKQKRAQTYIGAFDVLDARDFHVVETRVGDKIELVGQIVSVKEGVGKRGRGKGQPHVFINFGIWNKESVKITIWSEGLGNMTTRPTQAWVGKWISVTGLIEPPYEGRHYGKPYRSVGITVDSDNQIIQISERDARFRLDAGAREMEDGDELPEDKPTNRDILKEIQGGKERASKGRGSRTGASTVSPPPPPPKTTPQTRNQQILDDLRAAQGTSTSPTLPTIPTRSTIPTPGLFHRIPGWVWVVGVIAVILIFANRK